METRILKVVRQGEAFMVDSQKAEGGKLAKCNILLQEMGGKYENQYAATMLGVGYTKVPDEGVQRTGVSGYSPDKR